jgi:hypothetical protein
MHRITREALLVVNRQPSSALRTGKPLSLVLQKGFQPVAPYTFKVFDETHPVILAIPSVNIQKPLTRIPGTFKTELNPILP